MDWRRQTSNKCPVISWALLVVLLQSFLNVCGPRLAASEICVGLTMEISWTDALTLLPNVHVRSLV